MTTEPATPIQLDPREISARKRRNMWMAAGLLAFVVLMGVGTAIRIGQGSGTNPCEGSLYWDMRSNECLQQAPELEPTGVEPS